MAEPPATTLAAAATAERDVLLLARAGRGDLWVVVGGGPAEWSAATGHALAGS